MEFNALVSRLGWRLIGFDSEESHAYSRTHSRENHRCCELRTEGRRHALSPSLHLRFFVD